MQKNNFQFWNYKDVRKESFPVLKTIEVPKISTNISTTIDILISHGYLVPLKNTPQIILDFFKSDLTIENPEYISYVKYGKGFIPKSLQKYLYLYTIDSKYIALPRSIKQNVIIDTFKKQNINVNFIDIRPKFDIYQFKLKPNVQPWFYQNEAIEKIIQGNSTIKFSCGRGKTALSLIAVSIIGFRTLILLRNNFLLNQWYNEINDMMYVENNDIGIINGDNKKHGNKITLATVQTLTNFTRDEKRSISEMYGHIIYDECHEAAGSQSFNLLKFFKCKKFTGLSATPIRSDGLSRIIASYIGKIEKVDDSGSIPIEFKFVKTKFEFKHDGRKNEYIKMITALINDDERNNLIVEQIIKYKQHGMIFVYSSRIEHLKILQDKLKEKDVNIKTGLISSKTPDGKKMKLDEQEEIRIKAQKNDIDVIFGTQIIKQGFNAKPLKICIIAVPQKSKILIPQVIGRAQREYINKDKAYIIDFIDEKIETLLFQFYYKNRNIYKKYKDLESDKKNDRKKVETNSNQLSFL